MEVLSLDLAPDLSGENYALLPPQSEIDAAQIGAHVNWTPLLPSYLPQGFVPTTTRIGSLGGQSVLIQSYSDGLQELFVAQYPALNAPAEPVDGWGRLGIQSFGASTDAVLTLEGIEIHVRSKIDPLELAVVIESFQRLDVESP